MKEIDEKLTNREHEIYKLLISGKSYREICKTLYIAEGTLRTHISNLYRKKQVGSKTDLILKHLKEVN